MRAVAFAALSHRRAGGSFLLEALVAMVIFSLAFLGMLGMQARSVLQSEDAKYRSDAAFLANRLVGMMALANPTLLASWQHHAANTTPCSPSTANDAAGAAEVTNWLAEVGRELPGAGADNQQVKIDTTTLKAEVLVCWTLPGGAVRQYRITTQLN